MLGLRGRRVHSEGDALRGREKSEINEIEEEKLRYMTVWSGPYIGLPTEGSGNDESCEVTCYRTS